MLEAGNDQNRINEISDLIIGLREERQEILTEAAQNSEVQDRIEELKSFLDTQTEALTEYSDLLVRRLIKKVTIYDLKIAVEFKSGLTIEVET